MSFYATRSNNIRETIQSLNWTIILLTITLGLVGVAFQYSVGGESFSPWAWRHLLRLGFAVVVMILIASIPLRTVFNSGYVLYSVLLVGLVGVELFGSTEMGAQRWLDLGIVKLQPSELMRIGSVLALAKFYQSVYIEDVSKIRFLVIPIILILAPAVLVYRQPDLGTSILLMVTGVSVLFLAGVNIRYFLAATALLLASMPLVWGQLKEYQQNRILTFFDPERDPLGAGYHIIQSKIGIGSGGLSGKGFGDGTQSRLNFLPEKHTDFIFTIYAEEMGFFGTLVLVALFASLLIAIYLVTREVKTQFSRLLVAGLAVSIFLYIFVNLAMVMGIAPVVGVPLPFVSYGGTSLLTFAITIGLILCVDRQPTADIGK